MESLEANRAIALEVAGTQPTTNLYVPELTFDSVHGPDRSASGSIPACPGGAVPLQQNGQRWATVAELLPDAAMIGDEEMSLAVLSAVRQLVSIKTDPE